MDLNIVPILDMLVCVIFFLLLTTSFMVLTKQTLPPSSVSTITDPVIPPPVSPKLSLIESNQGLKAQLSWSGLHPGKLEEQVAKDDRDALIQKVGELMQKFAKSYPNEKTLQIGLGAQIEYQNLISVMDAVKEVTPDMVLFDYREAEARAN